MARNAVLPHAEIGDLFGIFQSGAYGLSASPVDFLSHRAPAEVWVDAGQHELIGKRGEKIDFSPDAVQRLEAAPAKN